MPWLNLEQGSDEWLVARRGRITGSRFKDARELADAIRLAARPKGFRTQIVNGIRGLMRPADPAEEKKAAPAQITQEQRHEAGRLASEAALAYFGDFSVDQANALVRDAIKLDPLSVDANAMLAVLRSHLEELPLVRKAGARMRQVAKTGGSAPAALGTTAPCVGRTLRAPWPISSTLPAPVARSCWP